MQTAEHDKEIKKGEWCHFEKMMNNEVNTHALSTMFSLC
jgi:hypothetical protein